MHTIILGRQWSLPVAPISMFYAVIEMGDNYPEKYVYYHHIGFWLFTNGILQSIHHRAEWLVSTYVVLY